MKQGLAFLLALLTAVFLAACGGASQPPAEPDPGPSSVSESAPAPEAVPESSSAPEEPSRPEAAPAVLSAAPGVEVKAILPADRRTIGRNPKVWGGRLLVRVEDKAGSSALLSLDLETGEQVFSLDLDEYERNNIRYELRQSLSDPEEFSILTQEGCRRFHQTGQPVWEYTLPEAARAREEYPFYGYLIRWDVLPEQDLLAWSDPEGLWLAAAGGGGARLVLSTEEIAKQPEFSQLAEEYRDYGPEGQLGFLSVRLMDGGRTLAANFGSSQSQNGNLGLVILDLSTGNTAWYDAYGAGFGQSEAEYLDDTTLLANVTRINVVTGETRRASREELTDRFFAITGDFVHYYGVEETETEYRLVACTMENYQDAPPVLTVPRHQASVHMDDGACMSFYPFAADGSKVVCYYEPPGREGLLLVTLPEENQK